MISEANKYQNLSEYIIYLYKTEALIRSFNFDVNELDQYMISHLPVDSKEKQKHRAWYQELAEQMKREGIEKEGHLEIAQKAAQELMDLHMELLGTNEEYRTVFSGVRPHIRKFVELNKGTQTDPVQIALTAVFGFLLLRLNGKKVS